jgi:hypothetical protein
MKNYISYAIMLAGCVQYGAGRHGAFFYPHLIVVFLLIVLAFFLSSRNSSFQKEIRAIAIILTFYFGYKGLRAMGVQFAYGEKMDYKIFLRGSLQVLGASILLLSSKSFISEYWNTLKGKFSKANSK